MARMIARQSCSKKKETKKQRNIYLVINRDCRGENSGDSAHLTDGGQGVSDENGDGLVLTPRLDATRGRASHENVYAINCSSDSCPPKGQNTSSYTLGIRRFSF